MSITNDLEDWLEWFSSNTARVDISSAAAAGAGLCITGLVFLKVSMLDRVDPLDFNGTIYVVLLTTMPYVVAGLMIHLLWSRSLRRKIPSWIMIALLGSLLLVVSAGAFRFYTKALAGNGTPMTFETIGAFIQDKAKDGLGVFVVLSVLTLPITALVHYAENILKGVRLWHEGKEPPSILHDRERT